MDAFFALVFYFAFLYVLGSVVCSLRWKWRYRILKAATNSYRFKVQQRRAYASSPPRAASAFKSYGKIKYFHPTTLEEAIILVQAARGKLRPDPVDWIEVTIP